MSEPPEILPPESSDIIPSDPSSLSFAAALRQATPLQKGVFFFLSAASVASVSMFALGQFFQTRGVQNVLTSRVFLIIAALIPTIWVWQAAFLLKSKRWKWAVVIVTLAMFATTLALDRAFPLPEANVPTAPPKHNPLITIKLHPSAFPVSVPARTTLHILPLHPFQIFNDAGSQLHEYDNSCPTDRPWPSEKEIGSKPANGYEEVRAVEITNHGPGTLESGRAVFEVLYNKSFAAGCTAPPQLPQPQNDVVSIPTLDQGQTFSFVSVNQTDGCAWLLPPDEIRVKMAIDEYASNVPLKLEPISVPHWVNTPFGPTAIKWEGVPIKNPGYGIARSGATCESPKPRPDNGALEREAHRRKFANREQLADLLQTNTALKNKCFSASQAQSGFSCEAEFDAWSQRSTKVLDTIERSYRARFDAATGLNYSWPSVSDPNIQSIINTLNHKADALKEFIKEQE
jgi:hypothetical protein